MRLPIPRAGLWLGWDPCPCLCATHHLAPGEHRRVAQLFAEGGSEFSSRLHALGGQGLTVLSLEEDGG